MFNWHGGVKFMMGKAKKLQPKLFYTGFSLEGRIVADHPLRRIRRLVDFDFVRGEVAELYGGVGNPSVDPAVIIKLMFLLFYENVKSERALMDQLPLRLDWLWFCDYDLEECTPNHSVLSKARRRWGFAVFSRFFERILQQCIDAGLVDGEVVHIDSSMIDANASKDKLQPQLRRIGEDIYKDLDSQCDCSEHLCQDDDGDSSDDSPLERRVNPVDPDARLGKKYGHSTLGYKDNRVVDDCCGIVTATVTTPANVNDSKVMPEALWLHEINTKTRVQTVVADKGYGVIDNYKRLHDSGVKACIPHQRRARKKGKFPYEKFKYDRHADCYICPAAKQLRKVNNSISKRGYSYRCPRETCEACEYFKNCVTSKKYGRLVTRNIDAPYVEWADSCLSKGLRHRLQGRRRYKAEGSYADAANNHGFKRARWRTLARMRIQNLMIAATQNLRKLMRYRPGNAAAPAATAVIGVILRSYGVWRCYSKPNMCYRTC